MFRVQSLATVLGAWLGATFVPLDWAMPFQVSPIYIHAASTVNRFLTRSSQATHSSYACPMDVCMAGMAPSTAGWSSLGPQYWDDGLYHNLSSKSCRCFLDEEVVVVAYTFLYLLATLCGGE